MLPYMTIKKINEYINNFKSESDSQLIIYGIAIFIGCIIFLGGLMYEKIKERRTCIKHLLILSGCNLWSYWLSYFIIDLLKITIFIILLTLPIYFKTDSGLIF